MDGVWLPCADDPRAGYVVGASRDTYRVLQVTDFHTEAGAELADRTWSDVAAMIDRYRPDLLAVTGDVWCGDDEPERARAWMRRDLDRLDGLETPWAFTWGNHDYGVDHPSYHAEIASRPFAVMPRGDLRGNYRIEVRQDPDSVASWDLFFLNSHTRSLGMEDLDWFEREEGRLAAARGRAVPSIVYFHIPLKQYEDVRLAGTYEGEAGEEALYWGDDGTLIYAFRRVPSVRAVFVGHSHRNDYHFVDTGTVYAYGRATGHGGYGGEVLAKGGKLLELDLASDRFTFRTVFAGASS